jgi:Phosphoenolpyruvate-protein kinase (PTS system EI component in bacteria)
MAERGKGIRGFAKGKAFVVRDCGQRNPFEGIPSGSILVASSLTLSDSTLIDFSKVSGMVTEEDPEGHVCLLGQGLGIPAIVGIAGCTRSIVSGDRVLIQNLDVLVNPDLEDVTEFERLRAEADTQLRFDF